MTFQEFLKKLSLFSGLADAELDQIAPLCRMVEGKDGTIILKEGNPVRSIYFLITGEAAVIKGAAGEKRAVIGTISKGGILGELSLYDNTEASATIQATQPFKALAIDSAKFKLLLENNQGLGYKVFKQLARNTSLRLKMVSGDLAECIAIPDESSYGKQ